MTAADEDPGLKSQMQYHLSMKQEMNVKLNNFDNNIGERIGEIDNINEGGRILKTNNNAFSSTPKT